MPEPISTGLGNGKEPWLNQTLNSGLITVHAYDETCPATNRRLIGKLGDAASRGKVDSTSIPYTAVDVWGEME